MTTASVIVRRDTSISVSNNRGPIRVVVGGQGPAGPSAYGEQVNKVITNSGSQNLHATLDDRVYFINDTATDAVLPTVAARIAAVGYHPYFIKNQNTNPALYPVTVVRSGSDTVEDSTSVVMDTRDGHWYWPDDSVSPNNWEIR